jgi:hypothetical protein
MPKVEIDTPGVTIRLDASEVSIEALGKQAMDMFKEASEVARATPPGPAFGFGSERRGEGQRGYHTEWHQPRPTQEATQP